MKKLLAMAAAAIICVSCGGVKTPINGAFYLDVKDGMAVTANAGSSKVGTATVKGYLCVFAKGDASIQAAAKEAGITRIHHVDYHSTSILGIVNTYTVFVYGE